MKNDDADFLLGLAKFADLSSTGGSETLRRIATELRALRELEDAVSRDPGINEFTLSKLEALRKVRKQET